MRRTTALIHSLILGLALLAGFVPEVSAGPNLLPNPGFEESVAEPVPELRGKVVQPLLPSGWAFEGLGFFDHGTDDADLIGFSAPREYDGRFIAVGNTASLKARECSTQGQTGQCIDMPTETVKSNARPWYQVNPHWRNAVPVPVTGGRGYGMHFHVNGELLTEGTGPRSAVRWLDANMLPISVSDGPGRNASGPNCLDGSVSTPCPWMFLSTGGPTLVAPANARFAVVMFGHSSDISIGQARFDNVLFG